MKEDEELPAERIIDVPQARDHGGHARGQEGPADAERAFHIGDRSRPGTAGGRTHDPRTRQPSVSRSWRYRPPGIASAGSGAKSRCAAEGPSALDAAWPAKCTTSLVTSGGQKGGLRRRGACEQVRNSVEASDVCGPLPHQAGRPAAPNARVDAGIPDHERSRIQSVACGQHLRRVGKDSPAWRDGQQVVLDQVVRRSRFTGWRTRYGLEHAVGDEDERPLRGKEWNEWKHEPWCRRDAVWRMTPGMPVPRSQPGARPPAARLGRRQRALDEVEPSRDSSQGEQSILEWDVIGVGESLRAGCSECLDVQRAGRHPRASR